MKRQHKAAQESPKPVATKQPSKPSSSDGAFDKTNLFKQAWSDVQLSQGDKQTGDAIQQAKKTQAHTYMSSYCSIDKAMKTLAAYDSKLTVETLVIRAASKAFSKTFKLQNLSVAKVAGGSVSVIANSEKLNMTQLKGAEHKGSRFAAEVPSSQLEIHQVQHAVEALPIANPRSLLTLHFT